MASFLNDVKFTSSTSGTADFGIGAAASGFQTPATAGAVDETSYSYTARSGAQFESGVGSYEATGPVLERTTVLDSSAGYGVKVNFTSAPTVILSPLKDDLRAKLTADTFYYVATTGSDATGTGTQANPWATPAKAADYASQTLDLNGYNVFVEIADGVYDGFLINPLYSSRAQQPTINTYVSAYWALTLPIIQFRGNAADPTAVKIGEVAGYPGRSIRSGPTPFAAPSIKNLTIDTNALSAAWAPVEASGGVFFVNDTDAGYAGEGEVQFLGGVNGGDAIMAQYGAFVSVTGTVVLDGNFDIGLVALLGSQIQCSGASFEFQNSVAMGAFALAGNTLGSGPPAQTHSQIIFWSDVTFAGTFAGEMFRSNGLGSIVDTSQLAAFGGGIPGTAWRISDSGMYIYKDADGNRRSIFGDMQSTGISSTYGLDTSPKQVAGVPDTGDLTSGFWNVIRNQASGGVGLYYNDNGTLRQLTVSDVYSFTVAV